MDGYCLLGDSAGWFYATVSDEGEVVKSSFPLVACGDEDEALKAFKRRCPRNLRPQRCVEYRTTRSTGSDSPTAPVSPVVGKRKALVILMQFQDLSFVHPRESFETLFNAEGDADDVRSVRDYYQFASQGLLDYESDIYGPYTSACSMAYYGRNDFFGYDENPVELCKEAIRMLPEDVDLSVYDCDNDGLIVYHVHPEIGSAIIANSVNSSHPQHFYPVCASGSFPLQNDYGEIDSDGCPFPGRSLQAAFSSLTSPSAVAWDGTPSAVSLSAISQHDDGTVSFSTEGVSSVVTSPSAIRKEYIYTIDGIFLGERGEKGIPSGIRLLRKVAR